MAKTISSVTDRLIRIAEKRYPRDLGAAARYVADELRQWSYTAKETEEVVK